MTFCRTIAIGLFLLPFACPGQVRDNSSAKSLFDPARHMRVSEVKPGMKGYGLSVFQGTRIDRFDVEVTSILKNFNPKHDVILIRCHGANLEHTTAIAGMSGSPIYLRDDNGKDRMIGAFAYGWPLQKDAIAGVQPIEYMLDLPIALANTDAGAGAPTLTHESPANQRAHWSLKDVVLLPGMQSPPASYPLARWGSFLPNPKLLAAGDDTTRLQPFSTPLMAAGLSPRVMEEMGAVFRAYGLTPLQAGGGGSADDLDPTIEPGSVLAVPLLEGDVDLSAVGTCTEKIGDRIVAFGHPFMNEGPIALPLGSGSIQGIVANYMTSFKLGALAKIRGTLTTDEAVGIGGILGQAPPMVPIELHLKYADNSNDDLTYHFTAALHPKFTPLLCAAALNSALSGTRELPQYHTVDYDLTLDFNNGKTIHVINSDVNVSAADLFFEIGTPLIAAAENPFERVMVKRISGTMTITPTARQAEILYGIVPRSRYRPGETVTAYVTYRPFRAGEVVLPVALDLPRDLPDGTYQLTISDWQKYLQDEQTAEPFKFTAETVDQVFEVVRDVSAIRHDSLYIRLLRQPDGVAIGHTAMPKLPSSRREVMIGAGRSDITQFVSSSLKIVPTGQIMSGSADFEITIDKNADTDVAGPVHLPHRDVRPAAKPVVPEVTPKSPGNKDN